MRNRTNNIWALKGYIVPYGYMGHIGNNKYMLFATENDYLEYMEGERK